MNFGEHFHTASRKGCDTPYSTGLWNGIQLIIDADEDKPKTHRAWRNLCMFADGQLAAKPETPIWDVAIAWTQSESCVELPHSYAKIMLCWLIENADQTTQDEMNATVKYWNEL